MPPFSQKDAVLGLPFVVVIVTAFIIGLFIIVRFEVVDIATVTNAAIVSAPVWLPIILFFAFRYYWLTYIRAKAIKNDEYTLLEIRLPQEIAKSPLAMEIVLSGLYRQPGETTWYHINVRGSVRPWWSLEIVSIEGQLHFYIWTRKSFQRAVENEIYAQYPNVEINEVEDYAGRIQYDPKKMTVWGLDHKLTKPDPLPIRTYVDFGLDKVGTEEEEKIDPLNQMLEWFGSIGKGEQLWLQILFRVNRNPKLKSGALFKKVSVQEEAEQLVNEILLRDPKTKGPGQLSPSGFPILSTLSDGEKKKAEAIERNMSKLQFDVGIRSLYISDKEHFSVSNILSLIYNFRPFNSNLLNSFRGARWHMRFDYPWDDPFKILSRRVSKQLLDAYRRRSWFHAPYKTPYFIMSSEELATIYHFPGRTATAPTLGRIPSIRKEPPPNLPI